MFGSPAAFFEDSTFLPAEQRAKLCWSGIAGVFGESGSEGESRRYPPVPRPKLVADSS
jgi:hypothetical protein